MPRSLDLIQRFAPNALAPKNASPSWPKAFGLTERLGLEIVERTIRRSELYLADEVFLTGTAAHIQPVGSLDNRQIGDGGVGAITRKLSDLYLDLIRGKNPKYVHWCTAVSRVK